MLRWTFGELDIRNVWLDTGSLNDASRRAHEQAGFREIGRIREAWRIGGAAADVPTWC